MLSSGSFPGVCSLNANVSERSVYSILIGVKVGCDCGMYVCVCMYVYVSVYLPFVKVVIS
jgi:hypothetical protein